MVSTKIEKEKRLLLIGFEKEKFKNKVSSRSFLWFVFNWWLNLETRLLSLPKETNKESMVFSCRESKASTITKTESFFKAPL